MQWSVYFPQDCCPVYSLMLFVLITEHHWYLCRVFLRKEDREGRLIEGFNPVKLHDFSFLRALFAMHFLIKNSADIDTWALLHSSLTHFNMMR